MEIVADAALPRLFGYGVAAFDEVVDVARVEDDLSFQGVACSVMRPIGEAGDSEQDVPGFILMAWAEVCRGGAGELRDSCPADARDHDRLVRGDD